MAKAQVVCCPERALGMRNPLFEEIFYLPKGGKSLFLSGLTFLSHVPASKF